MEEGKGNDGEEEDGGGGARGGELLRLEGMDGTKHVSPHHAPLTTSSLHPSPPTCLLPLTRTPRRCLASGGLRRAPGNGHENDSG